MARSGIRFAVRRRALASACVSIIVLVLSHWSFAQGPEPVDTLAHTHGDLLGIAVASDGTAYTSDVKRGEILKVSPDGAVTVLFGGLQRPSGLVLAGPDLLIAEEGAGRVIRLTPTGALSVLAKGMKTPRWLALAADGTLYITATQLSGPDGSNPDEAKVIIRRDASTGQLTVVGRDIHGLESLALNGTALFAVADWVEGLPQTAGVIARYPLRQDGGLDPPAYFVSAGVPNPRGLVLDPLAALYVTAGSVPADNKPSSGAIVKAHSDAHVTPFATSLSDPQGLSLGPDGSLYVADGRSGRLVRFPAPPPPRLDEPAAYTSQSPLPVSGTAVPNARIDLFINDAVTAVTGTSGNAGAFTLQAPLELNAKNGLEVFATALLGDGLTSAPAQANITHDSQPPTINFVTPPANVFLRQTAAVQAQASGGGGSPLMAFTLSAGAQALTTTLSPAPPASVITASASWNTTGGPEGAQTLIAKATDQAGNTATATRTVIVDNTPPDTQITAGPSGGIGDSFATFTVTSTDNLAPVDRLQYAWRLDGGAYSAFDPSTQITLSGLSVGPHTFEVKARDVAGNEDPTPAQQGFSVVTLGVHITSPLAGATVPAGPLLVRGTVNAPAADVGVTVNGRPAAVQGGVFAALVSVDQSTTQLVALATSSTGSTTSDSITIGIIGSPSDAVVLSASPESGVTPLRVGFSFAAPRPIAQVALDFDGNGSVDFQGASLDGQIFTYVQPGLYFAKASVVDTQGNQVSASTIVQVLDQAAFDVLLRAKWTAMKDALRAGDIQRAVESIALEARDTYRDLFTSLQPRLSQIDTILIDIQAVSFDDGRAEYQMLRVENTATVSYPVMFVQDEDGVWRLESF
jgi:hypothetical protein